MIEWLLEPLSSPMLARGLIAGLLSASACAVLSAFIVWRGLAFMGDAISHAILPGIVIARIFGASLLLGALGAALVAVLSIGFVARDGRLKEDSAIGVFFAGFFALGIILMDRVGGSRDLSHVLFGYMLGVSNGDLVLMGLVVALVLAAILLFNKELLATSFDPAHAVAIGLSPSLVRYGLLLLLALTTVVSVQTVGVVLVIAQLVTPGATASLLSRRLPVIILISMVLSFISTLVGFYASYYADLPPGASIVLVLSFVFAMVFLVHRAKSQVV